ncbi:MAG TPA: hypothetical protein DEQ38_07580 [Elusimicrobia bacterium]|nr:MAG: hypothetical protein A2089_08430 [Elusimicrobia bacterium GWD2_63_28]HCC47957.1 hypothetical protein [Elusimicrobiota bacterium]
MGNVPFAVILFAVLTLPASGGEGAVLPAASVGGGIVSEQDISDWQAAQGCYGEDAITSRKAGFMRMFEATILEDLLVHQATRPINAEDYAKEVARIDRETRAPDILGCIKKYFGEGTARYERVFIRPILAQRFLREYVKTDPAVQAKAYAQREGALKDIAKKKAFKAIGEERGIAYSTSAYAVEEDTTAPQALEPWKRWSPFEAAFINEHLKGLKPGEVKPQPIEDEANIKFVRLIKIEGKKYYFETLTIAKLTTEDYLRRVTKLPCRINDRELHDWVAPIKGNPLIAPADLDGPGGASGAGK